MKKIKLLTPFLGLTALTSAVIPLTTSCSCSTSKTKAIPSEMLDIEGYTLYGIKDDANLLKYNTLNIPENVKFIGNDRVLNLTDANGRKQTIRNTAFMLTLCSQLNAGNIHTVKFPKSVKEIRNYSFAGCNSIQTLDFSDWTAQEIYYAKIAGDSHYSAHKNFVDPAFAGLNPVGKVIFNKDLTEESKEYFKAVLMDAGLSPAWFTDDTEGDHIKADATWMKQPTTTGTAEYKFLLNKALGANEKLFAMVTKTDGTDGVTISSKNFGLDYEAYFVDVDENNVAKLPVTLYNYLNKGDYADFNVTFAAVKATTVEEVTTLECTWKQTLTGFKITNEAETVDSDVKHNMTYGDVSITEKSNEYGYYTAKHLIEKDVVQTYELDVKKDAKGNVVVPEDFASIDYRKLVKYLVHSRRELNDVTVNNTYYLTEINADSVEVYFDGVKQTLDEGYRIVNTSEINAAEEEAEDFDFGIEFNNKHEGFANIKHITVKLSYANAYSDVMTFAGAPEEVSSELNSAVYDDDCFGINQVPLKANTDYTLIVDLNKSEGIYSGQTFIDSYIAFVWEGTITSNPITIEHLYLDNNELTVDQDYSINFKPELNGGPHVNIDFNTNKVTISETSVIKITGLKFNTSDTYSTDFFAK